MATPPLTDDECQEAADAVARHHGSVKRAAEEAGINYLTFKSRLKVAALRGIYRGAGVLPGFQIARVSTTEDANGDVKSRSIVQKPERKTVPFTVPLGMAFKRGTYQVDADGNVVQHWPRVGPGEADPRAVAETIMEAFADWTPPAFLVDEPETTNADLLTVYPIADAHLGLKAMAGESGADYDLDIAADRFRKTTARLFDRSPNSDTALILQLGDWTHADDDLSLTPASKHTLQTSDPLLYVVRVGVDLMADYIFHALRKHNKVIVKVLRGNHDRNAWISLYIGLRERFRGNNRVTIDDGEADYWFFRWGVTLLGAHHGHRMKAAEMAGSMAMECREDWGETLYRIFLHGHLHHEWVKEILGVRVECFRTLAEADLFHAGKYGSGKSLISITLHYHDGPDGRQIINLPPTIKRAARSLEALAPQGFAG